MEEEAPLSAAWTTAFTVVFYASLIHLVLSVGCFILRRNKYPITGHSIVLCMISVISIGIAGLLPAAGYMGAPVTCWMIVTIKLNFSLFGLLSMWARGWRIYVMYQLQTQKLGDSIHPTSTSTEQLQTQKLGDSIHPTSTSTEQLQTQKLGDSIHPTSTSTEPRRNSVHKLKRSSGDEKEYWLATEGKLVVAVVIAGTIVSAIESIPYIVRGGNGMYTPSNPCYELRDTKYAWLAITGTLCIGMSWVFKKLLKISDGYTIKSELFRTVIACSIAVVLYMLPFPLYKLPETQLTLNMLCNGLVFFVSTVKIVHSFHFERRAKKYLQTIEKQSSTLTKGRPQCVLPRKANMDAQYTLDEVLDHPHACEKFQNHLKLEWSGENLMFYRAVNYFKSDKVRRGNERTELALAIYAKFIDENGTSMVNLPHAMRKDITTRIENHTEAPLEKSMFDEACHEIYKLMRSDTFVRFSSYYSADQLFLAQPVQVKRCTTHAVFPPVQV